MTLRVATWNVWHKFGDHEARQPMITETLQGLDADVIGLQETWPGQVQRLADALGYHSCFSGYRPDGDDPETGMGNAILSRHPIMFDEHVFLDDGQGRKYRTALGAVIEAPFGLLAFFTTHLSHLYDQSAVRMAQLQEASEFIEALAEMPDFPPILVGDLNAVPDSDEVRRLNGRSAPYVKGRIWTDVWEQLGDGPGITWSSDSPYLNSSAWPNRRLDYVFIGWPRDNRPIGNPSSIEMFGLDVVDGIAASDHYGLVVDIHTTK